MDYRFVTVADLSGVVLLRSVRLLFSVRGGRCTLSVMAKLRVQVRQVRKAEKSGGNPWWGRATDRHMETFTSTHVSGIPTSRHLHAPPV